MPQFLKPAASSRHRRACTCLALYKTLHQTASRVPLPDDVLARSSSSLGPENPLRTLIRNAFRRNRKDTSPRLVASALKNGYRCLALLDSAASDPTSRPYSDVASFLRANTEKVVKIKAENEAKRLALPRRGPREDQVPIITKVSKEGEPPRYVPTRPGPRPAEELRPNARGEVSRKIPRLDIYGLVPFLRLHKPMSAYHERVVRQVSRKRQERVRQILEMQDEGVEIARQEDAWEREVARLAREQGGTAGDLFFREREGVREELSHQVTMRHAVEALSTVLEEQRIDLVARGEAMWEIERRETEQAAVERKERLKRLEGGLEKGAVERFARFIKREEGKGRKVLRVVEDDRVRSAAEELVKLEVKEEGAKKVE
ncbi:hypothetical protein QBC42DRAFT_173094 [Cladorrhinum samala]|uniref:Uncharacterized protein n=1 Tax=Cladorrhinum samala TaxID=585594 RepID=A0AAV9HWZ2_9PEZI|nr:hypothetical protein QBC42DRAFT_173094 [Cladorrhinum samala]